MFNRKQWVGVSIFLLGIALGFVFNLLSSDPSVVKWYQQNRTVATTIALILTAIGIWLTVHASSDEEEQSPHSTSSTSPRNRFLVPFMRNPKFIGREKELDELHALLQTANVPVGVVGMGGVGKTQLVVEYCYRHKNKYEAILWLNGALELESEFARAARALGLVSPEQGDGYASLALGQFLKEHPNTLLVLDNLVEISRLFTPFGYESLTISALPCKTVFTSITIDSVLVSSDRLKIISLASLNIDEAIRLLLLHRRTSLSALPPEEQIAAKEICRFLGNLPLALELASAYLGRHPDLSLREYLSRIQHEGRLLVLERVPSALALKSEAMPTRHQPSLEATLRLQWASITDDERAILVMQTASQFPEAQWIPAIRLGVLIGETDQEALEDTLHRLWSYALLERLAKGQVRLHPLIREFAKYSIADKKEFRKMLLGNVWKIYRVPEHLNWHLQPDKRGVEDVIDDLDFVLAWEDVVVEDRQRLWSLREILRGEALALRQWDPHHWPSFALQQIHNRCVLRGEVELAAEYERALATRGDIWLRLRWRGSHRYLHLEQANKEEPIGWVNDLISLDEEHVAVATVDGSVSIWETAPLHLVISRREHNQAVEALAYAPEAKRLISGGRDQLLLVWNVFPLQVIQRLVAHKGEITAIGITPDGKIAVSGSRHGEIIFWDIESGQPYALQHPYDQEVVGITVTPDKRHAITASVDGPLIVWDLTRGEILKRLDSSPRMTKMARMGDNHHVVTGHVNGEIRVWDIERDKWRRVGMHKSAIRSLDANPALAIAVTGHTDGAVICWQWGEQNIRQISFPTRHQEWVRAVAITPLGTHVIAAAEDGRITVWDRHHVTQTGLHDIFTFGVNTVQITPEDRFVITGSDDHTVHIWDLATGQPEHSLVAHTDQVETMAISPSGHWLASAGDDKTINIWSLETYKMMRTLRGHQGSIWALCWGRTHDQEVVISGGGDQTLRVWDPYSGKLLATGTVGAAVTDVILVPEGNYILVGTAEGQIQVWLWEPPLLTRVHSLQGHDGEITRFRFLSGTSRFLVSSEDGLISLWEFSCAKQNVQLHPISTLQGHESEIWDIDIHGGYIASVSTDRTLLVWDIQKRVPIAFWKGEGEVWSVTWAHQQQTIVCGDELGNVWALEVQHPTSEVE